RINVRTRMWGELAGLLPSLTLSAIILGIYASRLHKINSLSELGEVITIATLMSSFFPTVMSVSQWSTHLAMDLPSLIGLRKILDQPDPRAGRTDMQPLVPPIREIAFENVSFFIDDQPLVQGMSFTIPGGKFTAIVGQS